jgi:hypothetical protein
MADQYDVIAVGGNYEKDGEEKARFLRIGVAFPPGDKGKGWTLKLDALPISVDGRRRRSQVVGSNPESPLINIGCTERSVQAMEKAILAILRMPVGDEVKKVALEILGRGTFANATLTNCVINGPRK